MTTNAGRVTLDQTLLENLFSHAALAAHLVGHLDDDTNPILIRQLGDHVDAIAHELAELLGDRHALTAPAAAPDDREAHDGAPMLTSGVGGIP